MKNERESNKLNGDQNTSQTFSIFHFIFKFFFCCFRIFLNLHYNLICILLHSRYNFGFFSTVFHHFFALFFVCLNLDRRIYFYLSQQQLSKFFILFCSFTFKALVMVHIDDAHKAGVSCSTVLWVRVLTSNKFAISLQLGHFTDLNTQ